MKKITTIFAVLSLLVTSALAQPPVRPTIPSSPSNQRASEVSRTPAYGTIQSISTAHNMQRDGKYGLGIYVHFSVHGMTGRTGSCAAYFYFAGGQQILKDFDGNYTTTSGQVSVGDDFVPKYQDTEFTEFFLFLPYDQLHLGNGKHDISMLVGIFDGNKQLASSNLVNMQYTNN